MEKEVEEGRDNWIRMKGGRKRRGKREWKRSREPMQECCLYEESAIKTQTHSSNSTQPSLTLTEDGERRRKKQGKEKEEKKEKERETEYCSCLSGEQMKNNETKSRTVPLFLHS